MADREMMLALAAIRRQVEALGGEEQEDRAGQTALDRVRRAGPAVVEEVAARGKPWGSRWSFGVSISGATVTVAAGIGKAGGVAYESAETEIEITGSEQWIGAKWDPDADEMTVEKWAPSGVPQDYDGCGWVPLVRCSLSGGVALVDRWGAAGEVVEFSTLGR